MESRPASFSADEISIDALYLKSCEHDQLVELTIELKRFRSWMTSFNMLEIEYLPPKTLSVISGFTVLNYARIIKALVAAKQDLMEEAEDSAGTKRDICSSLRWHNTALMNSVTQRYHMLARDRFETEILETQYSDLLDVTRSAIQDLGGDHRAASLLATKRMTILEERRSLICKPELKLRVIGEELRVRVESITEILNSADETDLPHVLHCHIFFHNPTQIGFGLVYDVPPSEDKRSIRPVALKNILQNYRGSGRPLLEDRFQLAHKLVSSILTFHKVDWLHKALNSPNILFFPRYDTPAWEWARTPYIVGFTRSRQNRKHAFTEGPAEWREFKDYQHPQYLENCERFREEFDYDSHGILLLEIGLWNSLSALTSSKGFVGLTPTQFAQRLVEKRIPQLGLAMGTNYARRRVFVSRETSAWTLL